MAHALIVLVKVDESEEAIQRGRCDPVRTAANDTQRRTLTTLAHFAAWQILNSDLNAEKEE